jgi:NifU-like protein
MPCMMRVAAGVQWWSERHGLPRAPRYDPCGATPVPSAAVNARLAALRFAGELTEADAVSHGCHLITASHGAEGAPERITLSLLVDQGGLVTSARFRSAASGDLLAAYDGMLELVVGHLLIDAKEITPRRVEALLRGSSDQPAFDLTLDADKPFFVLTKAVQAYEKPKDAPHTADQLPWGDIGLFEKVRRIETVLDQHVRPALASDGGGIDLVDLQSDELIVQYHGACGSCSSSIGGTLTFIQDSLNNHLGTTLKITVSQLETEEAPSFVP